MNRLAAIAFAIIAIPAVAFSQGIEVTNEALLEIRRLADDGTVKVEYVAPDKVVPGDAILYRITYANTGMQPADGVVVVSQIPDSLIITEGSAEAAGTRTQYSVDGGKTYADRDDLYVTDADGKKRPAEAGDLTNVRWTVLQPLGGGLQAGVSYRAVVK